MIQFVHKIISKRGLVTNDKGLCVYCGLCEKTCHHHAITVNRTQKKWIINHNQCMRCRHCIEKCPKQSLKLSKD